MKSFVYVSLAALVACGPEVRTPEHPTVGLEPSALPEAPASASSEVAAGMKLLEAGNLTGAREQFEGALQKNPKDADAQYYVGVTYEKAGEKPKAEAAYKAALALKPGHEAAAVNLSAGYIDAGKFGDAIQVCQAALAALKKSGQVSLNLGLAYASAGQTADAATALEDASTQLPKDPMVALSHGMWLGKWKKTDAAKARLIAARELAGGDLGVLASAGFELKNIGAFSDCIVALDRAIEKKDAAELRTYRALCKMGQSDKAGALSDLEVAVKNEPKYAPAHFYLAGQVLQNKKKVEAIAHYEQYLALEPQGPLAASAQERIKILKKK